jgi:transposase
MTTVWLGVDMAKANFAAAAKADGEVSLGEFSNDLSGFTALAAQVATYAPADVTHLVVEPTSGYQLAMVPFAFEQGWQVSLPNLRHERNWAKGIGLCTKTDRQDALLLARYGVACQPAAQAPVGPGSERTR